MRLIDIPLKVANRHRLIRRLPEKSFTDLTGIKHQDYEILGLAGILNYTIVWLCRCKCGTYRLMSARYIEKRKSCKTCSVKERNWGGLTKMGVYLGDGK